MKVGIMQPYFFPYIGYWQLMNTVDRFVAYDNIEYTKKGWINRNRYLIEGIDKYFTIPIKKDSDYKDIVDRNVTNDKWRDKIVNQLKAAYNKAPYFRYIMPIIEDIINYEEDNLFLYIYNSIICVKELLDIQTDMIISSNINGDGEKGEKRVIDICLKCNADTYINPIGAKEIGLYKREDFKENNIELRYLKPILKPYKQFDNDFVPGLSIIDVLMFNGVDGTREMLGDYELIEG